MKNLTVAGAALFLSIVPGALVAKTRADVHRTPNEVAVLTFYNTALNRKDYATASKYLGDHYIQHNPNAVDDKEGFKQYVESLRKNYPEATFSIRQVFSDGDFVILHVLQKLRPGDRGRALADFYRLEHGKIAEHWDVVQSIPDHSANNNGMF